MNLMTSYTKRCDESVVRSVPEVEGTKTWVPIHHGVLIDHLQHSIIKAGMSIQSREYSLSADGGKMFGLWQIGAVDRSMAYMVGIRNAINKTLAVGIVAGSKIFVCDNLAFSGDLVQFRRHTKNSLDELQGMCDKAIMLIANKVRSFAEWHKKLKTYALRKAQAELLIIQSMKNKVLPPSQFNKFYSLFFDQRAPYGRKPDLWSFHEAMTEIHRERNLFDIFERNQRLNLICNEFIARYGQQL